MIIENLKEIIGINTILKDIENYNGIYIQQILNNDLYGYIYNKTKEEEVLSLMNQMCQYQIQLRQKMGLDNILNKKMDSLEEILMSDIPHYIISLNNKSNYNSLNIPMFCIIK